MAKIYIASSWKNPYQPRVINFLRVMGHEVYDFRHPPGKTSFRWSQIDKDWKNWSMEEYNAGLEHPIAQAGFNSDFEAMQWADTCVLVLPCGGSAHSEAGWMKGAGKQVMVYSPEPQLPELMYKLYDSVSDSLLRIHHEINIRHGTGGRHSAPQDIAGCDGTEDAISF